MVEKEKTGEERERRKEEERKKGKKERTTSHDLPVNDFDSAPRLFRSSRLIRRRVFNRQRSEIRSATSDIRSIFSTFLASIFSLLLF